MKPVLLLIFSYLLGSVPFGLIIAKAYGKDLRAIGSGNIGATNLARALGKKWAYFCFCLDLAKGLLPMLIAAGFISSQFEGTCLPACSGPCCRAGTCLSRICKIQRRKRRRNQLRGGARPLALLHAPQHRRLRCLGNCCFNLEIYLFRLNYRRRRLSGYYADFHCLLEIVAA